MKLKNCLLGNKSFLREGDTTGKNHTKWLIASEASKSYNYFRKNDKIFFRVSKVENSLRVSKKLKNIFRVSKNSKIFLRVSKNPKYFFRVFKNSKILFQARR